VSRLLTARYARSRPHAAVDVLWVTVLTWTWCVRGRVSIPLNYCVLRRGRKSKQREARYPSEYVFIPSSKRQ
jgi:hypothetical protein